MSYIRKGLVVSFFLLLLFLLIACQSAVNRDNRLAFVINESYTDSVVCTSTEEN